MRLLYVADGRSPIALNWIRHFVESGHEVHLISTYPCQPSLPLASLSVAPVAFSGLLGSAVGRSATTHEPKTSSLEERATPQPAAEGSHPSRRSRWMGSSTIGVRKLIRHWLGPSTVKAAAAKASAEIARIQPQLVHAMRIPFEGMLAAAADPPAPLLLSVWGNDFTLHASASPGMRRGTARALGRAQALHADCERDRGLAADLGFDAARPSIVLPGGGGVRPEVFGPSGEGAQAERHLERTNIDTPQGAPTVINPRGFRGYVRNDTFFRSIPLVLAQRPEAIFLCPAMLGEPVAERWLSKLGIAHAVRLLPRLSPEAMATAFRRSQVMVSPTEHDGTPNTLLEAMACGVFPIAGDLSSIREWIEPETNGLLIDPADPQSLAAAILRALGDAKLRAEAAMHNAEQIRQRAHYPEVMAHAEDFYRSLIASQ